jgi:flagellar hook-associated protein 1 FlgK
MSLFGSIQMAGNTLQAMQIGLHVVGNNIANSNTPGYIRESAVYTPAPVQRLGNLTLGLGVDIAGIVQNVDKFTEERLRDVGSDRSSADVQQKVYGDLESILGELSDTDVSTSLTNFFNSIDEISNQPEEMSIRNLAVQSGKTLAQTINTLDGRVKTVYNDFGTQVTNLSSEVNTLTEQIRKLNLQITEIEGGNPTANQAGGLRSQRNEALKRLAEIADVKTSENPVGAVNVTLNGDLLVFEGTRREVKTDVSSPNGRQVVNLVYADNDSPVIVHSGELQGVYDARDNIVGGFIDKLDKFAGTLAFEFNKVYSQGQGASGYQSITSTEKVSASGAALDSAGLAFTPVNGQFNLLVYNTTTKLTETHAIKVDLDGLQDDSSLATVAAQINAIDGVSAEVTADNRLKISADSAESRIAFGQDSSGFLAAVGLNTFFTGSKAGDIAINSVVAADGSKFAAGGAEAIGVDVTNAQKLVALHDQGLSSLDGNSITGVYDQMVNDTSQGATVAKSVADGFHVFEQTLQAQAQSVSGVNLDEEAIDMIMLQRTYQASAKYISTLAELLDVLVKL